MIRTEAVNFAPILDCSNDGGKTAGQNASDQMVMEAVWIICQSSLLLSQQHLSDLSLEAQDDALKRSYQKKHIIRELKMPKSAKAKLDDLLATESHQLWEHMNYTIRVAMEALVFGAGKVSTTRRRQFQVRLNRARQAATTR